MEQELQVYVGKVIGYMQCEAYKPMTVQELEQVLELTEATDFRLLVKALVHLEEVGKIVRTRANRYALPSKLNLVKGVVNANARGFAFVAQEDSALDDIYIPAHELNHALHGDTVLVRISSKSGTAEQRQEGVIVRVLERGIVQSVGTYSEHAGVGFVIPDDKKLTQDIFIPKQACAGAVSGHKVVYRITHYPDAVRSAEGEVVRILGHQNDPGVDILSIIYKHDLPQEFPEEVLEQANQVVDTISEQELVGRRDLRNQMVVTIDGSDAKDLDDAVAVTRLENGHFKLGVHIADVSHYLQENSPLDLEAYERGTSVYLVDRVIPMIPHRLSNGVCSLNPQVDRLTLSCEMEIDGTGKVVNHEIFQSVICTTERMTYSDVNAILMEQDAVLMERYTDLVPMFQEMEALATVLRKKRMQRGAIDFDFKEAKVLVDDQGAPEEVVIRERSVAEKLIEEFMLIANETVAEHFHWLDVPFIYRIHGEPKAEKLQHFFEFILHFGYIVRGTANEVHPRALQEILEAVQGTAEGMVISTVMLRSMQQAKYSSENLGHFGLSTEFYTHFTSPIRRYPDLIVHRLIRAYLIEGAMDERTQVDWAEKLVRIADHSSDRERRAVDAERETDELKKAEWMSDKIGETFTGMIRSVTSWGMFVELENTVEGLVHISNMADDYYHFNNRQFALIGERTGKVFQIGDEVTVACIAVNQEERTIDFEIVGMPVRRHREAKEKKFFKVSSERKFKRMTGRESNRRRSRKNSLNKFREKATGEVKGSEQKTSCSSPVRKRKGRAKRSRYYPDDKRK